MIDRNKFIAEAPRDRPVYVDEMKLEPDREAPATPEQAEMFRKELLKRLKDIG